MAAALACVDSEPPSIPPPIIPCGIPMPFAPIMPGTPAPAMPGSRPPSIVPGIPPPPIMPPPIPICCGIPPLTLRCCERCAISVWSSILARAQYGITHCSPGTTVQCLAWM